MARERSRSKLPDPEDVLRGRVRPGIEELIALIHEVNPSFETMTPHARRAAYETKAALQSVLIERFAEYLVVDCPPGSDGEIVGLQLRTYAKDACHAKRSQLTAAARAWLQFQLGTQAEQAPSQTSPAQRPDTTRTAEGGSVLAKGRQALSEYDFDAARQLFQSALDHATSAEERRAAAIALVELFVDHLADDQAALAVRFDLGDMADEDPDLRCLFAIAAARSGDLRTARSLADNLEHPRRDELQIELARISLAAGDPDACERALQLIPPSSERAAARHDLLMELAAHRVREAARLEAELTGAHAEATPQVRTDLARRILTLHPGSTIARDILRVLRQRA